MLTKDQVTEQFEAELRALLKKWSVPGWEATLEVEEKCWGYGQYDSRMEVCIPSLYDENHDQIRELAYIDLGKYFSPT